MEEDSFVIKIAKNTPTVQICTEERLRVKEKKVCQRVWCGEICQNRLFVTVLIFDILFYELPCASICKLLGSVVGSYFSVLVNCPFIKFWSFGIKSAILYENFKLRSQTWWLEIYLLQRRNAQLWRAWFFHQWTNREWKFRTSPPISCIHHLAYRMTDSWKIL